MTGRPRRRVATGRAVARASAGSPAPAEAWAGSPAEPVSASLGSTMVAAGASAPVWARGPSHPRSRVDSPTRRVPGPRNECHPELAHLPAGCDRPVTLRSMSSESSEPSRRLRRPAQQLDGSDSGDCCQGSPPSLKANPGSCPEELRLSVPESNPVRIANTQTTIAVIHVIRTAARPADLISEPPFTMTKTVPRTEFSGRANSPPKEVRGRQMSTPGSHRGSLPAESRPQLEGEGRSRPQIRILLGAPAVDGPGVE